MDRDSAADDCTALLTHVDRVQDRWQSSHDPLVRDLAPRLDELVHVLARLDWLLRREQNPVGGR